VDAVLTIVTISGTDVQATIIGARASMVNPARVVRRLT
jgi:hypothetical protein